ERSSDGTNFTQIGTASAGATTYSDTGLSASTKYYYRVRAAGSSGDSGYSNTANATTSSPPAQAYVSDLPFVGTPTNGWGPIERDKSNGENGAGDGRTIMLNGVTYAKGLGTHAMSSVKFSLGGSYGTFTSDIGIDDEVSSSIATAIFQVFGDGVKLYESPVMSA